MGNGVWAGYCYKWALKSTERRYGLEHAKIAEHVRNLGNIAWEYGRLEEARCYYARTLVINEKEYGLGHPIVLGNIHDLGKVLYEIGSPIGNLQGVIKYYKEMLMKFRKRLGREHPYIKELHDTLKRYLSMEKF
ncbi:tetratricopeptide repeat protein [Methylomusa anaerophila]|uniref:tetratricopeptide repeat protein n=1 Tax=Methylomusa anaerophila TaxID=1930071 RepID=UPI000F83B83D|nr:tetratricopeptide repeat protein [Methylomusa anaerophila]